MEPLVLTLPGLWNSGPAHWQTHWEAKHPSWRRVLQREWETPQCSEWVDALRLAISTCERPPVLAAHSLACVLVARWAYSPNPGAIAGAFLVAPSDVEAPSYPAGTTGFLHPCRWVGCLFPPLWSPALTISTSRPREQRHSHLRGEAKLSFSATPVTSMATPATVRGPRVRRCCWSSATVSRANRARAGF